MYLKLCVDESDYIEIQLNKWKYVMHAKRLKEKIEWNVTRIFA